MLRRWLWSFWHQWLSWVLALIAAYIGLELLMDWSIFRHRSVVKIVLYLLKIVLVAVLYSALCQSALQLAAAVSPDTVERSKQSMKTIHRNIGDWERFANPLGLIRLVLLVEWDPIGVFGYPGAMNEYDSYAEEIYALLVADTAQEALAAYLRQIEEEQMGIRGKGTVHLQTVAAKLRLVFDTSRAD